MITRDFGTVGESNLEVQVASATASTATCTFTGRAGTRISIARVVWSYSAAPTGGNLVMTGVSVIPNLDISAAGPGSLSFAGAQAPDGTTVTVTLASGGGAIVGKLYVEAVRRP